MAEECGCGSGGEETHSCPFQEEMNENYDDEYCTCCSHCTEQCAMDV